VLLQGLEGEVVDFLVSEILYLLLHDPDHSLFLHADDIVYHNLLGSQKFLQLFILFHCLTLFELSLNFFTFLELSLFLLF
jgi:hypothetical protein